MKTEEPEPIKYVQVVSIGRLVHYRMSTMDAEAINKRRSDAAKNMDAHRENADGSQIHVGNEVREGDVLPMTVVCLNGGGSTVNGQVTLDGTDTYWATSRFEGDQPGQWFWPPYVPMVPAPVADQAA